MHQCLPTSLTLKVKVPISGPDYLSDLSSSHLFSYLASVSHTGLLVLSWTRQEQPCLKASETTVPTMWNSLLADTCMLLHFFRISAKMSPSSPHQHALPCLYCFIFLHSTFHHYFYIFHQHSIFICLLSDSLHSPVTLWNMSSSGAGIFFCSVHCCLSSTWDGAWDVSDMQIFVEWMDGWTFS